MEEDARRTLQDAADLEALATLAGRKCFTGGKHPMWQSAFSAHRSFPIPRHGGNQKVGHHPQKVILEHIETDAVAWEEWLDEQEPNGDENGNDQSHNR